jgi:hypothetical protein
LLNWAAKLQNIIFQKFQDWYRWFTSVIPATWEVEIGRIEVQDQPGQKVSETPS